MPTPFDVGPLGTPAATGPSFGTRGVRRYYNPANRVFNTDGSLTNAQQFNKPAIHEATKRTVRAHTNAQYFRHAGMGAAIRYTLGMEQVPSHVSDYLNAYKHNAGLDPRDILALHRRDEGEA